MYEVFVGTQICCNTKSSVTDKSVFCNYYYYHMQAVAMHCRFIRMGASTGITNALLSRLLVVREELTARMLHEPAMAHVFTIQPEADGQI